MAVDKHLTFGLFIVRSVYPTDWPSDSAGRRFPLLRVV